MLFVVFDKNQQKLDNVSYEKQKEPTLKAGSSKRCVSGLEHEPYFDLGGAQEAEIMRVGSEDTKTFLGTLCGDTVYIAEEVYAHAGKEVAAEVVV